MANVFCLRGVSSDCWEIYRCRGTWPAVAVCPTLTDALAVVHALNRQAEMVLAGELPDVSMGQIAREVTREQLGQIVEEITGKQGKQSVTMDTDAP